MRLNLKFIIQEYRLFFDDLEGVTKVKPVNRRAVVEGVGGVNLNSEKSCIKDTVQKINKSLRKHLPPSSNQNPALQYDALNVISNSQ